MQWPSERDATDGLPEVRIVASHRLRFSSPPVRLRCARLAPCSRRSASLQRYILYLLACLTPPPVIQLRIYYARLIPRLAFALSIRYEITSLRSVRILRLAITGLLTHSVRMLCLQSLFAHFVGFACIYGRLLRCHSLRSFHLALSLDTVGRSGPPEYSMFLRSACLRLRYRSSTSRIPPGPPSANVFDASIFDLAFSTIGIPRWFKVPAYPIYLMPDVLPSIPTVRLCGLVSISG